MNCESEDDKQEVTSHINVFKFAALEEHLANKIIQTIDGSIPKQNQVEEEQSET